MSSTPLTLPNFLAMIDHAVLGPGKTTRELEAAAILSRELQIASLCVNPDLFFACREFLQGSEVSPSSVLDFPHGASTLQTRIGMMEGLLKDGGVGSEIDIVSPLGLVVGEDWHGVEKDLRELVHRAKDSGAKTKIIIETRLLQRSEIERMCEICAKAETDFVKSNTGFNGGGAELEKVKWMREATPKHIGIKASGGIKTFEEALAFLPYADRLGMSGTKKIAEEAKRYLEIEQQFFSGKPN